MQGSSGCVECHSSYQRANIEQKGGNFPQQGSVLAAILFAGWRSGMGQNPGIRTPKIRITVFLVAVTVLTILVSTLDGRGVFGHAGSLMYMWCPALAAILASVITARSFRAIGWTTKLRWLPLGWLIPIAYAA